ncbi:TIGR02444 family protein [Pseudomaricurvus sp.]|uniref:TIGR02444 family protein n=1 Tax=Pseudomaricurvus sp. TaxID=2004510 RepID=UPI003F6A7558
MSPFPESLWDFSLSIYAEPEMEALCLHLQDRRGINVNLLLWALWLDARSRPFQLALWQQGVNRSQRAERWRVGPLRRVRRFLPKRTPWQGIRSMVKTWELQSEQRQLQDLQKISDGLSGGSDVRSADDGYLIQLLGSSEPEYHQLMQILEHWSNGRKHRP